VAGGHIDGWETDDIYLQRFNEYGTPVGPERQVNPDWHGAQSDPDVAVADDGRCVVVWTADDGDGSGIHARLFGSDGSPLSDAFLVNTYTTGSQSTPEVAINPATGTFVIVWASEGQDGSGWGEGSVSPWRSGRERISSQRLHGLHQSSPGRWLPTGFCRGLAEHVPDGSSWGDITVRPDGLLKAVSFASPRPHQ
jgi:hypothetical protein